MNTNHRPFAAISAIAAGLTLAIGLALTGLALGGRGATPSGCHREPRTRDGSFAASDEYANDHADTDMHTVLWHVHAHAHPIRPFCLLAHHPEEHPAWHLELHRQPEPQPRV